jgi:hypothetical protein
MDVWFARPAVEHERAAPAFGALIGRAAFARKA